MLFRSKANLQTVLEKVEHFEAAFDAGMQIINYENWQCTYCSGKYYSYRKNNETKMRQFSMVKIL